MKKIYTTKEWKGQGKQSYSWNEYRQDGDTVHKFNCHRRKSPDYRESSWDESEKLEKSWKIGDSDMPDWLNKYLK